MHHVLFVVLLVVLATLLAYLSRQYRAEVDFTQGHRNTLSPVTLDVLKRLEAPVKVTAYAMARDARGEYVHRRIEEFMRQSLDTRTTHGICPACYSEQQELLEQSRRVAASAKGAVKAERQQPAQPIEAGRAGPAPAPARQAEIAQPLAEAYSTTVPQSERALVSREAAK